MHNIQLISQVAGLAAWWKAIGGQLSPPRGDASQIKGTQHLET